LQVEGLAEGGKAMLSHSFEATAASEPRKTPTRRPPQGDHEGQRILVVEDDPSIRGSLLTVLTLEGYPVSCCEDGNQALEFLANTRPSPVVIILDLMLPVMDGWEFRVRQRADPRIAKIPVLAISADSSAKAAAIDADAYLRKPFDVSSVLHEIDRIALERGRVVHRESLVTVGTLAASVAHEIRNPLTFVLGNLEFASRGVSRAAGDVALLRRESLPSPAAAGDAVVASLTEVERSIQEALVGLDRISSIAGDLGLLGRRPDARRERVALRPVMESAIRMAAHHIQGRARLVRDYADVPTVMADRTRLTQVFLNLLVNACQALSEDAAWSNEIRVRILRSHRDAIVEVEDTGVGIAPEAASRLFEPFFTTKGAREGSGLGLSISRDIVQTLGGMLDFTSVLGKGSRFRVVLPISLPEIAASL
jgi:two-component system NtrC family sensor kinase